MRLCATLIVCTVATALCCPAVHSRTLTFDDVPPGTGLEGSFLYCHDYRAFMGGFQVIDHVGSTWGPPRSGRNVAAWRGSPDSLVGEIAFGYITAGGVEIDQMCSVSGYFSTQTGALVRMTAIRHEGWVRVPVATMTIGTAGGSWNNRLVTLGSSENPVDMLIFEGVHSRNDLLGFCLDDLTYAPIPEPSSLATLACGLLAVGVGVRRSRNPA